MSTVQEAVIGRPQYDQLSQLLKLRTEVFVEEAILGGVPEDIVRQHVAEWLTPENERAFRKTMIGHMGQPEKMQKGATV